MCVKPGIIELRAKNDLCSNARIYDLCINARIRDLCINTRIIKVSLYSIQTRVNKKALSYKLGISELRVKKYLDLTS